MTEENDLRSRLAIGQKRDGRREYDDEARDELIRLCLKRGVSIAIALRTIHEGEELFIDYQLSVEGRRSAAIKRLYACRCGSKRCRGTMLAA
jgi:hypothetical protein